MGGKREGKGVDFQQVIRFALWDGKSQKSVALIRSVETHRYGNNIVTSFFRILFFHSGEGNVALFK